MEPNKELINKIDALVEELRKSEHITRTARQDITITLPYKEYEMYKKMFSEEDDSGG